MKKLKPWITLKKDYIHKDEWVTLRADSCETASGVVIEPFYVFEYLDWVHTVVVRERREVFLVQQYRHGAQQMCWELPGGKMEETDSFPIEAGKRELLEETGMESDSWELISSINPNPATHTNRVHSFLVEDPVVVAEPRPDPAEEFEYAWFSFEDVISLIRLEKFNNGYQIGSFFLALQQLGVIRV